VCRGCDGGSGGAGCGRCARRNAHGWREKARFRVYRRARGVGDGSPAVPRREMRLLRAGVSRVSRAESRGIFVGNGDGWSGERRDRGPTGIFEVPFQNIMFYLIST
jgi:hypothetical protein